MPRSLNLSLEIAMRYLLPILLFVFCCFSAMPAQAQLTDVRFGLAANAVVPIGENKSFDRDFDKTDWNIKSHDSFATGPGVSAFVVATATANLAWSMKMDYQRLSGTSTLAGRLPDYRMTCDLMSLGVEAHYFLGDGSAHRYRGAFFIGGIALDCAKYSVSDGRVGVEDYDDTNVTRPAANVGIGYSFDAGNDMRWILRASVHKQLGNGAPDGKKIPCADSLQLGIGFTF